MLVDENQAPDFRHPLLRAGSQFSLDCGIRKTLQPLRIEDDELRLVASFAQISLDRFHARAVRRFHFPQRSVDQNVGFKAV